MAVWDVRRKHHRRKLLNGGIEFLYESMIYSRTLDRERRPEILCSLDFHTDLYDAPVMVNLS